MTAASHDQHDKSGDQNAFDETVDFLVAGSGASGLTAALAAHARGLRVLVIEKGAKFGGSTAMSGGGTWIPNAPAQLKGGYVRDVEEVVGYLRGITDGLVSEERIRAFVENGPRAMTFLEGLGDHVRFEWKDNHPDYYMDVAGSSERGSLIAPAPIDLRALRDDEALILPPMARPKRGVWIGPNELPHYFRFLQDPKGRRMLPKLWWRQLKARITGERIVTGGPALASRLMLAVRDAGIDVRLSSPLRELITDDRGSVIGAIIESAGRPRRIGAGAGVLIATGGFEGSQEMRDRYQPEGRADLTMANRGNTGDGIRIAEQAGAELRTMDSAWWYPAVAWTTDRIQYALNERMLPSQLVVNAAGKRFIREPMPYSEFGFRMIDGQRTGVGHIPSWLILDDWAWRRYLIFGHLPIGKVPFAPALVGRDVPDAWRHSDSFRTAGTITDLAAAIGVPADALEATVNRYNDLAARGVDEDFHRGENAYDRTHADLTLAHPNLEPLHGGPYYAFRLVLSDLGTNGGVATDEFARALRPDGSVIRGLYASGNASSAVMGRSYAAAGATLGPAMTFGFIAANDAAKRAAAVNAARRADGRG